ncbi:hypothetical protein [Hymenobacter cheonanensis]|uniref:hypothetical protein n=1 Tax=Hymenobacter sp. CA2-7 TaxID=3063993 RepID=UPI0027137F0B|nr:hypothetical protein [Hymenobacter sp. CA2-7]MDO7887101.1 hypothetical protein [Hymenobacter sp. CA2-7]
MSKGIRNCKADLNRPDVTSFASLFLLIGCFWLLTATLKRPPTGLVLLEETPRVLCNACFNAPNHTQIYVCLTANGRVSFATSEPSLQLATLEQMGKKYGVRFSTAELTNLKSTAFLAVRLEKLTAKKAYAPRTAFANLEATDSHALSKTQLLDCVERAQMLSPALTNMPAGIYLAIDAQTKASLVMHLVNLFQQRKINRLYLLTHCYA